MATGFPEIDVHYKEWICRINVFDNAVINHTGPEARQDTLDFPNPILRDLCYW
jgi:hypothetical protein